MIDRRALPAEARLGTWLAPDGWRYRRLEWPGRGRGSLLFAGGRGDFIEKYLEAQHHWHAAGWSVTAFDWRSQGGSRGDIVGGHLESMDPLVDDLAALIADWRADHPGPHVVVAHSMGGHILARTLAERRPEINAAVLIAPMMMVNSEPLPPWAAAWTARLFNIAGFGRAPIWRSPTASAKAGARRRTYLTSSPERFDDELWWWEREPGYNLGPPSWGWLLAAMRSSAALTLEALRRIDSPCLFVATERDRLVSAAAIRRAAEAIPNAELLMLQDSGHEILRESDPVRLRALAAIDAFLARHAAG
ncbi:alpha/beta hydrolase [Sphingosinicella sp. BN140058]|uniref:alpha/beta hydrolase n=1 Tax=Sphingosinicella sp. BN140058 TaxID=1892855 RepID=UPI001FB1087F|nr:alpha/beta hydrolase [Sphingosinicella sp. BN140058]